MTVFQQSNGLWCPDTGQTCFDWTMIEIGIPALLMNTIEHEGRPINNIIHAGANIGIYTLEFAKRCKNVYVFEPANENFTALSLNCAYTDNVFLYKAALGNTNNPINVVNETADRQCGAWRISGAGDIPTLKIDDLNLNDVSLIHLDIEGYELFALQGAENTIRKHKPLLAFEILNHASTYQYTENDIFAYVTKMGYTRHQRYANEIMFLE